MLYHFSGLTGCIASEVCSFKELNDLLTQIGKTFIRKQYFVLEKYNSIKMRLVFGRRNSDEGQEPLSNEDLVENDRNHMLTQNEIDAHTVIHNNHDKSYEIQSTLFDINLYPIQLYEDDNDTNSLYYDFYFQMKQMIKKWYLHASGPINR